MFSGRFQVICVLNSTSLARKPSQISKTAVEKRVLNTDRREIRLLCVGDGDGGGGGDDGGDGGGGGIQWRELKGAIQTI